MALPPAHTTACAGAPQFRAPVVLGVPNQYSIRRKASVTMPDSDAATPAKLYILTESPTRDAGAIQQTRLARLRRDAAGRLQRGAGAEVGKVLVFQVAPAEIGAG